MHTEVRKVLLSTAGAWEPWAEQMELSMAFVFSLIEQLNTYLSPYLLNNTPVFLTLGILTNITNKKK